MSSAHGSEGHGGGHSEGAGGSNAMGECLFAYCPEVGSAARGVANMVTGLLDIFGDGGGGGGHGGHGHH